MVLSLKSIVLGLLLGISLAAPPGPMNALIAEQSVRRGWIAGFRTGFGALCADAVFCLLAFAGATTLLQRNSGVRSLMLIAGGALMLYFAYAAATAEPNSPAQSQRNSDVETGFFKAFFLALTNPYQISWWITVGVGLIQPGSVQLFGTTFKRAGGVPLLVGFFGGIGLWIGFFPAVLVGGRRRFQWFGRFMVYGSALLLAGFAVVFLTEGFGGLLVHS